ncbi:hypothetical protein [Tsuneonella sp. HG222]
MSNFIRQSAAACAALFIAVATIVPVVTVPSAQAASVIALPTVA